MEHNAIPTSEVLHLAADAIERQGWSIGNGWHWEQGENLCLEGGIAAAMGINIVDFSSESGTVYGRFNREGHTELLACPAYQAVREYLAADFERIRDGEELWRWNDSIPGSQAVVVETLRAAAEVEYAKEHAYDVIIPEQPVRNS